MTTQETGQREPHALNAEQLAAVCFVLRVKIMFFSLSIGYRLGYLDLSRKV
jgi:hypothetical protein